VQRLTEDQRARIEKLATAEGTACEGCGRAGLRCGEEARRTQDHGLMVYLWCANEVHPLRGSAGRSRTSGRTIFPAVTSPALPDEPTHDDDHLGEGHLSAQALSLPYSIT
jgi:hypothetical protein